jgi:serine-type D-Ala-D-Ala carboxypeptidase (penicillin-binding protein 5/6)
MKKIGIFLCLIFLIFNINAVAKTSPKITAQGAVLIDLNNGRVLLQKNSNNKYAPASTTKVMTALLTLEKCKLDEKVIVGKNPPLEDGSKICLIEGETLTVKQLLYALLLPSANDAALALAEHISGSKQAFANLMNKRAKELGCKNTNFVNPNGLYDKNHYTSAYDLSLIASKAMKFSEFRKIVSTLSFKLMPTNKQPIIRYLHNENKILFNRIDKYSGAVGIKTGYTVKAMHTYVGAATRKGITLIVVLLHDEKGYYKETANLFNYGFKKLLKK